MKRIILSVMLCTLIALIVLPEFFSVNHSAIQASGAGTTLRADMYPPLPPPSGGGGHRSISA